MTDGVNKSGQASISEIMSMIDLGPTDSIQFMFAKLQLAQAQICKNAATDYMNQIIIFICSSFVSWNNMMTMYFIK